MCVVLLLLAQIIEACAKRANAINHARPPAKRKKEKKTAKGDSLPAQISYKERGLSLCY